MKIGSAFGLEERFCAYCGKDGTKPRGFCPAPFIWNHPCEECGKEHASCNRCWASLRKVIGKFPKLLVGFKKCPVKPKVDTKRSS